MNSHLIKMLRHQEPPLRGLARGGVRGACPLSYKSAFFNHAYLTVALRWLTSYFILIYTRVAGGKGDAEGSLHEYLGHDCFKNIYRDAYMSPSDRREQPHGQVRYLGYGWL